MQIVGYINTNKDYLHGQKWSPHCIVSCVQMYAYVLSLEEYRHVCGFLVWSIVTIMSLFRAEEADVSVQVFCQRRAWRYVLWPGALALGHNTYCVWNTQRGYRTSEWLVTVSLWSSDASCIAEDTQHDDGENTGYEIFSSTRLWRAGNVTASRSVSVPWRLHPPYWSEERSFGKRDRLYFWNRQNAFEIVNCVEFGYCLLLL